jgi:hypothetical protein
MSHYFKLPNLKGWIGFFFIGIVLLQGRTAVAIAGDNDQEILNQLYQEIVSSSDAAKVPKIDSLRTPGKVFSNDKTIAPPSDKITGLSSEKLTQEIEKIIKDAKIRHSDAVKFLQDPK